MRTEPMGLPVMDSCFLIPEHDHCKKIYLAKAQSDSPGFVIPSEREGSKKDFSLWSK